MKKSLSEILDFEPGTCTGAQVRKLNRIVSKKYNDALSPFGVNISQANIIFATSSKNGILQTEIANALVLERSTLHRDIKRLIDRNLLRLDKNPNIKSPSVYLTDEGNAFVKSFLPSWKRTQKEIEEILGNELVGSIPAMSAQLQKK
jgi:DNA-binding MarR family transcriptional regulator